MKLLSYNMCRGGAGREDANAETITACAPDLVVFQEATLPAIVERLSAQTSMPYWASRPRQSLAFISRLPIAHYEWHRPRVSRHAFLEIAPADMAVRIFGVHLSAVFAAWTEQRRTYELRAMLASITRHQQGFHALVGDFNTVAPGELLDFRSLPRKVRATVWLSGGQIRWRTIQIVLDGGYADVFRMLHPSDPGLTLPPANPQVRLDYMFVPTGDIDRVGRCDVVRGGSTARASDHLPLAAEIQV
jgi:endonuclease/exonuclease/phosphatase family metal-dependent hydrolase